MDVTVGDKTFKVEDGLLYNKAHQWAKIEGDVVTVGITDFAQDQLGDVSLVELSSLEAGTEVEQAQFDGNDPSSDPIPDVSIESSKTVADLYSPLSGTIEAINEELEDEPEKLNEDPYGAWLFKLKATKLDAEKGNLMDAAAYAEFIKSLA